MTDASILGLVIVLAAVGILMVTAALAAGADPPPVEDPDRRTWDDADLYDIE
jgi:hypothetical protein